jgi:hypothetical protein
MNSFGAFSLIARTYGTLNCNTFVLLRLLGFFGLAVQPTF